MHVIEIGTGDAIELRRGERFTPKEYPARAYIVSRDVLTPVKSGGKLFIVANQIPGNERDFDGIQATALPECDRASCGYFMGDKSGEKTDQGKDGYCLEKHFETYERQDGTKVLYKTRKRKRKGDH